VHDAPAVPSLRLRWSGFNEFEGFPDSERCSTAPPCSLTDRTDPGGLEAAISRTPKQCPLTDLRMGARPRLSQRERGPCTSAIVTRGSLMCIEPACTISCPPRGASELSAARSGFGSVATSRGPEILDGPSRHEDSRLLIPRWHQPASYPYPTESRTCDAHGACSVPFESCESMDFLQLQGKTILVMGVANRKSVAWHSARLLQEAGANVILSVRSEARAESVRKLAGDMPILICDVEHQDQIEGLRDAITAITPTLHGIVHSVAFADYSGGWLPFHETPRAAFLQAVDISCYSLMAVCNQLKTVLDPETGSVVTISISTTRMAAENYGFMAPVKAALDSSLCFLAKSFSRFSKARFNAVCPGLLKTSASAGIPGYVDSYLFAEKATLRHEAVRTEEVAAAVAFLLSPRSSGINTQRMVIDAGMETNYFDSEILRSADPTADS
jgi:enoyl-[acyl-carrier protein] reductase I